MCKVTAENVLSFFKQIIFLNGLLQVIRNCLNNNTFGALLARFALEIY